MPVLMSHLIAVCCTAVLVTVAFTSHRVYINQLQICACSVPIYSIAFICTSLSVQLLLQNV